MLRLADPTLALAPGLAAIRRQFQVPDGFPPAVLAAAEEAARRPFTDHADRTDLPFVTLDPASSTDLDQAFTISREGDDLLLFYAIADVAWFVDEGGPIDAEAWARGATLYLPDGKAGLYPPVLSEGAASLLPDGPRPAVVFTVRVAPDGRVALAGAERAVIRSRAKLAYDQVGEDDLPEGFAELDRRIEAAEQRRGAVRVDPPEQEVARRPDGGFTLVFRPRLVSETRNASLSLATNLAVAAAFRRHRTGLFRVMAEPDRRAVRRLRYTARAYGLDWPRPWGLDQFERSLDAADPRHAAFMLAVRRAGQGAAYRPFVDGEVPHHAAVAAPYAHATAPLRRLADRYVVAAALALANGRPLPETLADAFTRLPAVMARAETLGAQVSRAVVDLAEAVMLSGSENMRLDAVVTDLDERGARIVLCDFPIVARIAAGGEVPGDSVRLRLAAVNVEERRLVFERQG